MVSKIVKWGVLGAARIAEKAVIPAIMQTENCSLEAIASRNPEKAGRFLSQFHAAKGYEAYTQLLSDPEVHAVYVPLPNALHKEWVINALLAGKHVLCEKPLGLNPQEVREMFDISRKADRILMEGFAYIHNPLIRQMRNIIQSGGIGEVRHLLSSFSFDLSGRKEDIRWSRALGGGAVYDLGCYLVHLARYLTEKEPTVVDAVATLHPIERTDLSTTALLQIDRGLTMSFHVSFEQGRRMLFEAQGTKGCLSTEQPFNESGTLTYTVINEKGNQPFQIESPNNYALEIAHVNAVIRGEALPIITEEDSIHNAEVLTSILERIKYGKD